MLCTFLFCVVNNNNNNMEGHWNKTQGGRIRVGSGDSWGWGGVRKTM